MKNSDYTDDPEEYGLVKSGVLVALAIILSAILCGLILSRYVEVVDSGRLSIPEMTKSTIAYEQRQRDMEIKMVGMKEREIYATVKIQCDMQGFFTLPNGTTYRCFEKDMSEYLTPKSN